MLQTDSSYGVVKVFTALTIQRHTICRVDHGGLLRYKPSLCVKVHNAYNTQIQKFHGGPSRYKLRMFLTFTKPTMQRPRIFRMGIRATKLLCSVSVLTVHSACNTKMQKFQAGPSRYKLIMSVKVHNACNTKEQKLQGGRSRYTPVASLKFCPCPCYLQNPQSIQNPISPKPLNPINP